MNSTVMSGTPRTNSMNATETHLTAGSSERRPNASSTPSGSENTMPIVGHHDRHQNAAPGRGRHYRRGQGAGRRAATGTTRAAARQKNRRRRGRGAAPTAATATRCRKPERGRKHRPAIAHRSDKSRRQNKKTTRARTPSRRPDRAMPAKPDKPRGRLPDHTASIRKNRTSGGTAQTMNSTQISVSAILPGWKTNWPAASRVCPARAVGGGSRSAGSRRR